MSSEVSLVKKNLAKSHLQKKIPKNPQPSSPQNKTKKKPKIKRRKPAQLLFVLTNLTLKSCLQKATGWEMKTVEARL